MFKKVTVPYTKTRVRSCQVCGQISDPPEDPPSVLQMPI